MCCVVYEMKNLLSQKKIFREINWLVISLHNTVWKSRQKRDHPEIFPSNHISKIDEIRPSVMDAFLPLGGFMCKIE